MKSAGPRNRVLNPIERFSEIVFALIMVLSFTCAFGVAEIGREDVRAMLIGAIGCNLAWGIIDAVFYLIVCLAEAGRHSHFVRRAQSATDSGEIRREIEDTLPPGVSEALGAEDVERIHNRLRQLPVPAGRARLTAEDWSGALGVFLLVFLSTLPVVLPFVFIHDARFALRISNVIAIAMLFGAGAMLARYSGLRPALTGLAMVGIGAALVAISIALGG